MKRLIAVLAVMLIIELMGLNWMVPHHAVPPKAPEPDLTGYPLVTQQKVSSAIRALKPEDAISWDRLADTFFACGSYPEAEACYRQATQLKPESGRLGDHHAFCLMSMGQLEAAKTVFRRVRNQSSGLAARCDYFLGTIALRQEDPDLARHHFELAGRDFTAAVLQLAILHLRSDELSAAKGVLQQLEKQHPNSFRVHQLLAEVESRSLQAGSAGFDAADVTAAGASLQLSAHREVADLVSEILTGPWNERAIELTQRAHEIGIPGQMEDLMNRLRPGALESVRNELVEALDHQWDPLLAGLLADVEGASGKVDRKQRILRQIVERDGWTALRALRLATATESSSDPTAVEAALKQGFQVRATSMGAEGAILCDRLAALNSQQPEVAQEVKSYAAEAAVLKGLNELQVVNLPQAARLFEASLKVNQVQPEVWYWLGRIRKLTGQDAAAVKALQECLQQSPGHEAATRSLQSLQLAKRPR